MKEKQTKAERLAEEYACTDYPHPVLTLAIYNELLRLSPMEGLLVGATSKCDNLLEVNEVLADSSKALLERYIALVDCGDCGNWNPEEEKVVIAMRRAFTLAGEIK